MGGVVEAIEGPAAGEASGRVKPPVGDGRVADVEIDAGELKRAEAEEQDERGFDHATVADDGDALAGMVADEAVEGAGGTQQEGGACFEAGADLQECLLIFGSGAHESKELFGANDAVFIAPFLQVGIGDNGQAEGGRNNFGSLLGADECAGEQDVSGDFAGGGQAVAQALGLGDAAGGEGAVMEDAIHDILIVAVANEIEVGHGDLPS